ncbi:MAG: ankyrin repeat domain-containing protein [Gammaproteobacteria bacterium]
MQGSRFDFKHVFDLAKSGQIDELNSIITTEGFPLHIRISNKFVLTKSPTPKLSTYKDSENYIQFLETAFQVPLLHYTLQHKRIDVLQYLLSVEGINPNIRSFFGRTPLQTAVVLGNIESVRVLLEDPRTDINVHDKANLPPLSSAITLGHTDIARLLIKDPRVDINLKSTNENVCLLSYITTQSYSFKNSHALLTDKYFNENIQRLIGPKPIAGSFLESPFALALQNGFHEIADLISKDPNFVFQPQRNQFYALGNIDYFGGLLAMGALKSFRKISSNCTLLTTNSFSEYLSMISQKQDRDIDELFILSDAHWLTGRIRRTVDNLHQIIILDSLGHKSSFLSFVSESIQSRLSSPELFVGYEKRQNSIQGCSMFSLDDLQNLFKVDQYLPKAYSELGLYGYLNDSVVKMSYDSNRTDIKYCQLPLFLLKSRQSNKLVSKTIPERSEENAISFDRKGRTAAEIAATDFVENKNHRIDRKLDKTRNRVEKFCNVHDEEGLLKKLAESSFAGFKKRFIAR